MRCETCPNREATKAVDLGAVEPFMVCDDCARLARGQGATITRIPA